MDRDSLILLADLVVDFLVIIGVIYLFSQGYLTNLSGDALNKVFLKLGVIGFILASITIYRLLKRK